jgi:hypothetical protein
MFVEHVATKVETPKPVAKTTQITRKSIRKRPTQGTAKGDEVFQDDDGVAWVSSMSIQAFFPVIREANRWKTMKSRGSIKIGHFIAPNGHTREYIRYPFSESFWELVAHRSRFRPVYWDGVVYESLKHAPGVNSDPEYLRLLRQTLRNPTEQRRMLSEAETNAMRTKQNDERRRAFTQIVESKLAQATQAITDYQDDSICSVTRHDCRQS